MLVTARHSDNELMTLERLRDENGNSAYKATSKKKNECSRKVRTVVSNNCWMHRICLNNMREQFMIRQHSFVQNLVLHHASRIKRVL